MDERQQKTTLNEWRTTNDNVEWMNDSIGHVEYKIATNGG